MEYIPFDYRTKLKAKSAKNMHRSICVPSATNVYAQAVQFAKAWFLSKFNKDTFKSVYIEGKYIFDDQRTMSVTSALKREKPSLAIVPNIDLTFTNENVDMYQYGIDLYQPLGVSKDSFFIDSKNDVYLGMAFETVLMSFTYKIRVETRAQQIDMYKYIQLACRAGNTTGEEVDLDFHIPYELMVQIATDLGYETINTGNDDYPRIKDITSFLSYLNTHSTLPFVYKYRGVNGKNEFFIRMQRMYIHIKSGDMSNDDGEREGHLSNNFTLELQTEVRFPAPKFYAYYSNNEHKIKYLYSAIKQPQGLVSNMYTFKGTPIPDANSKGWHRYLETTYEESDTVKLDETKLAIDFTHLLKEGDLGATIQDCIDQGISPSIFIDMLLINGGDIIYGNMDWNTMQFTSNNPVKTYGTYIGIYLDLEYINQYVSLERHATQNRIQPTEDPEGRMNKYHNQ